MLSEYLKLCKDWWSGLLYFSLAKPETVETLLKMVLDEPTGDVNDKTRFKWVDVCLIA